MPLNLINPGLKEACARDVSGLVVEAVRLAQIRRHLFVVDTQLREHIQRRDEIRAAIQGTLQTVRL